MSDRNKNPWANATPEKYDEWRANLTAAQRARYTDPEKRARALYGRFDHADCTHENTSAGRRRCARQRAKAGESK